MSAFCNCYCWVEQMKRAIVTRKNYSLVILFVVLSSYIPCSSPGGLPLGAILDTNWKWGALIAMHFVSLLPGRGSNNAVCSCCCWIGWKKKGDIPVGNFSLHAWGVPTNFLLLLLHLKSSFCSFRLECSLLIFPNIGKYAFLKYTYYYKTQDVRFSLALLLLCWPVSWFISVLLF